MPEYAPSTILTWQIAAYEAGDAGAGEIEPAHLLIALAKLCDLDFRALFAGAGAPDAAHRPGIEADAGLVRAAFGRAGLDPAPFRRRLRAAVARPAPAAARSVPDGRVHRSRESRRVFRDAERLAQTGAAAGPGPTMVRPLHLLRAILNLASGPWGRVLAELGVPDVAARMFGTPAAAAAPPRRAPRAGSTPTLDAFGRDLTRLAREGKLDPVVGRREEMRNLARALTQRRKSNAILVGDPGVGKTCIVEGLAQRLVQPEAPDALRGMRLVEISLSRLLAGASYRGQFEERLQAVVDEATGHEEIILFMDEIHTLVGAGGSGASDAANILKPALARGDLRCIGATTTSEYRQYIEKDGALERRFQVVWVEEPTRAEAIEILRGVRPTFEAHHGVSIEDDAVEAAVDLSMRYLTDFRLPDKAVDLIDQACARARLATVSGSPAGSHSAGLRVRRAHVAAVVAQRCRIPLEHLAVEDAERFLRMEDALAARVIGQDEAVQAVSEAIRTAKAGLKDPRRPIGVFLFAGTTGTGKTELAKALAEFLFGDEQRLIRIDMSEYMEKHAISRLIGAPPGYVGHDEEGQLTGAVRSHPDSVVLFDEVEKAHPDVMNIFLQIFDDGRLTDSHGRRVSFAETAIVLTSNLGTGDDAAARAVGFSPAAAAGADGAALDRAAYRERIMDVIRRALRPELLNRIQRVVFFYPLDERVVRQVIDKILDGIRDRLRPRRIDFVLTDPAYALLLGAGYDPRYGAREMERAVDRLLVQPLGKALLEGRFSDGAYLRVDAADGALIMRPAPPPMGTERLPLR